MNKAYHIPAEIIAADFQRNNFATLATPSADVDRGGIMLTNPCCLERSFWGTYWKRDTISLEFFYTTAMLAILAIL